MPYSTSLLPIPLDGTGTEIPALNVTDSYDTYEITGSVTTTGNYAIVPTGTPQAGTTFEFDYNAVVDITTNGNTFSIFGVALNQTQLLTKLKIVCRYDGSAWKVRIWGSLDQAIISSPNYAANSIANSKLATMGAYTLKGNNTGSIATPQDIAMASLTGLNYWSLIGNSGTTAGTNFLGTTDNVDVVFKRNSIESGRIGSSNLFFGVNAMVSITSGTGNAVFGNSAANDLTVGNGNTAIGDLALPNITTPSSNTALGYNTGATLISGDDNILIGDNADASDATATGRIALGKNAIADDDQQFALADSITKWKFRGNSYVLPASDGTAGQSLKTDGSGNLYWG